jgi:predicted phage tail protein
MTIDYDKNYSTPTYIKELNILIYGPNCKNIAKHPCFSNRFGYVVESSEDIIRKGASQAPIFILGNDPTGKIKHIYLGINGSVCDVNVSQDPDNDEKYYLCRHNNDLKKKYSYEELDPKSLEWDHVLEYVTEDGNIFPICLGKDRLKEYLESKHLENRNKFSSTHIANARKEVQQTLAVEIEQLQDTIKVRDKTISNLKSTHADMLVEKDTEIKLLNNRIASLQKDMELRLDLKKRDFDDDKTTIDMQLYKANSDLKEKLSETQKEIARLRVKKEENSVKSSQVSTLGIGFKTAAIVLPIAALGLSWLAAHIASSTTSAIVTGTTFIGSVGIAICDGVRYVGSKICDTVGSFFSWCFG